MNWANRITLTRIFLIIIIAVLMVLPQINYANENQDYFFQIWNDTLTIGSGSHRYELPIAYLIAGIIFIIASLTDMLDGYVARKYNQVTTFGKFFDAIADKLLTNIVLIIMCVANILPVWIVIILISRDFVVDVLRQILAAQQVVMAANKLGKYRATFEMISLALLFFVGFSFFGGEVNGTGMYDGYGLINQLIMIPMYITVVLSLVSGINYVRLNAKYVFNGMKQDKPNKQAVDKDDK